MALPAETGTTPCTCAEHNCAHVDQSTNFYVFPTAPRACTPVVVPAPHSNLTLWLAAGFAAALMAIVMLLCWNPFTAANSSPNVSYWPNGFVSVPNGISGEASQSLECNQSATNLDGSSTTVVVCPDLGSPINAELGTDKVSLNTHPETAENDENRGLIYHCTTEDNASLKQYELVDGTYEDVTVAVTYTTDTENRQDFVRVNFKGDVVSMSMFGDELTTILVHTRSAFYANPGGMHLDDRFINVKSVWFSNTKDLTLVLPTERFTASNGTLLPWTVSSANSTTAIKYLSGCFDPSVRFSG